MNDENGDVIVTSTEALTELANHPGYRLVMDVECEGMYLNRAVQAIRVDHGAREIVFFDEA